MHIAVLSQGLLSRIVVSTALNIWNVRNSSTKFHKSSFLKATLFVIVGCSDGSSDDDFRHSSSSSSLGSLSNYVDDDDDNFKKQ